MPEMGRFGRRAVKRALAVAAWATTLLCSALSVPKAAGAEATAPLAVAVGPVRRGSSSIPWRVANRGATPVERVALDAFSGVATGSGAARRVFECTWLPPGAETGGVFQAEAPEGRGPQLHALRATGVDLDGYDARAWSCTRLWPQTSGSAAAVQAFSMQASLVPGDATGDARDEARADASIVVAIQSLADAELALDCRMLTPSGCGVRDPGADRFVIKAPARGRAEKTIALRRSSAFGMRGSVRIAVETAEGTAPELRWCEYAAVPVAFARDASGFPAPARRPPPFAAAVIFALALAATVPFRRRRRDGAAPGRDWTGFAVAAVLSLWLAQMLNMWLALGAGTPVAGDLAAHNVLVARIAETGRIFGWESAWWCGFPAFRYYFPLPYAVTAVASRAIGHNTALALAIALPVAALPLCAWLGGRLARLPRPVPALLAAAALPVALDNSHTMWGGNAYSALSGMIANAWSFALMPIALGLALRDASRGRFSAVSALVFAALALCHFFAALIVATALLAYAAALAALRRRTAAATLCAEGATAGALCAFWTLPLAATRGWSVDYGEQWNVEVLKQLPPALNPTFVCATALVFALSLVASRKRAKGGACGGGALAAAAFVATAMLIASAALFAWGRALSDVFVNCRLWPFAVFSALALCAIGAGRAAAVFRIETPTALALAALAASFAWREIPEDATGNGGAAQPRWARECLVGPWAQSAFRGFEAMPDADALRLIAATVAGRPGAIAWDHHEGNEALGSARAFEALPYLAPGTRTLAGGLVNGALGAIAAHSTQSQMSDDTTGWPLLVRPLPKDPALGLRRLEALGVRSFVARSARVQDAIEADGQWRLIASTGPWRVYESGLEDPGLARVLPRGAVPDELPSPSSLRNPQRIVADWWNRGKAPPAPRDGWIQDATLDSASGTVEVHLPADADSGRWIALAVTADPGWEADGAAAIGVLPWGQMAVRPAPGASEIVLRRKPLKSERVGRGISLLAAMVLTAAALAEKIRRRRAR